MAPGAGAFEPTGPSAGHEGSLPARGRSFERPSETVCGRCSPLSSGRRPASGAPSGLAARRTTRHHWRTRLL